MNNRPNGHIEGLAEILDASLYRHSFWGLGVADLESGEPLLEINADKLFVPASTTKLWSSAAALDTIGAGYRFTTPIYRRGDLTPEGTLEGELILKAVGDPNFGGRLGPDGRLAYTNEMDHTLAGFFEHATLTPTNPIAGIEDLARQIAQSGLRRVRDVLVDDRLFDRQDPYFNEPIRPSAVMINDNIVDLIITPGNRAGEPAAVQLSPSTGYVQVEAHVETVASGQGTQVQVKPLSGLTYRVEGRIEPGRAPLIKIIWIDEPQDFARALLVECLEAQGIRVERREGPSAERSTLPDDHTYAQLPIAAQHVSPPFSETLRVTLKVSHNTMADTLPILVASHLGQRGVQAGLRIQGEFINRIGVEPGSAVFSDGAGGASSDHVTPRAVIKLLRAMASRPDFPAYEDALPILGVDGTLAHAVKPESPVYGKVHAKTGTYIGENLMDGSFLLSSKALAGYMTARSGRKLVFGMFLNRLPLATLPELMRQGEVLGSVCEVIYKAF